MVMSKFAWRVRTTSRKLVRAKAQAKTALDQEISSKPGTMTQKQKYR